MAIKPNKEYRITIKGKVDPNTGVFSEEITWAGGLSDPNGTEHEKKGSFHSGAIPFDATQKISELRATAKAALNAKLV